MLDEGYLVVVERGAEEGTTTPQKRKRASAYLDQ
jgi:hypothetical protein